MLSSTNSRISVALASSSVDSCQFAAQISWRRASIAVCTASSFPISSKISIRVTGLRSLST
jgi:hypothetical protein